MELEVKRVKIVVTIPPENTNHLREKIGKLGAGKIGEYTYCTTSTKSVGTFLPSEKANPYIGQNKKLETVEEDRLEFICEVEKESSLWRTSNWYISITRRRYFFIKRGGKKWK